MKTKEKVFDKNIIKCSCGESEQYEFEKRFYCLNCDKEICD